MSNKVPQIRFNGYSDAWEERKLGDEFKKVSERNDGSFGRNHWISVAKMYFQRPEKVQSNNIDTRTYVMREGDIAFEGHPNSEFKFGRFVANDIGAGVVSELFPIYRHQHEYDNNYWKNAIQIERNMAPIFAKSITSSGNSSNKLDTKHFLRQKILIPQINEQKKIGSFFKQLDATIALHQRKLDLLKEQKKGYLQKMFPKNGAKVPELRFAGFADDWEERKLKDVLDISKTKNKAQQYGKVDVLSVSREVGTVNQIKYQGRSFAGSDLSNYKVVQGGELIYTKSPLKGAPYGIFQVATIKGILSPLYAVYTSTDKAYTPFVAMALKNDNIATHYLTPLVTKGAKNTINVTDEGALEGKIQFPSILEQKQIFIFFKQLDDTIALHQRKLDSLKEQKKGFLQKMFV